MGWDPTLHDVTDIVRWDNTGMFRANNGPCELYSINYDALVNNIPKNLNFNESGDLCQIELKFS